MTIGSISLPLWLLIAVLAVAVACIAIGLYLTITGKTLMECFWAMVSRCPWLRRKQLEASD